MPWTEYLCLQWLRWSQCCPVATKLDRARYMYFYCLQASHLTALTSIIVIFDLHKSKMAAIHQVESLLTFTCGSCTECSVTLTKSISCVVRVIIWPYYPVSRITGVHHSTSDLSIRYEWCNWKRLRLERLLLTFSVLLFLYVVLIRMILIYMGPNMYVVLIHTFSVFFFCHQNVECWIYLPLYWILTYCVGVSNIFSFYVLVTSRWCSCTASYWGWSYGCISVCKEVL